MKSLFIFLALITAIGGLIPIAASAHDTITYEDLGGEPSILPTSPFYFLKEFRRDILRAFAGGPEFKAKVELQIAKERLAEIKKLTEEIGRASCRERV